MVPETAHQQGAYGASSSGSGLTCPVTWRGILGNRPFPFSARWERLRETLEHQQKPCWLQACFLLFLPPPWFPEPLLTHLCPHRRSGSQEG